MIVYLRAVPGFWIASEELRRPDIRSRPVIMGGLPHERGAVRELNALAGRYGVRVGMALSQAYHHCPNGVFLVPDLAHYRPLWKALCDVLSTFTPLVEPLEMGQAVLDLSGCERRWGTPLDAARAITAGVSSATGITPWLGVASNRLVAQMASSIAGEEGISVVAGGQERSFLASLPLTLLPDLDARLALTLNVLGLRTIGQLAALPAAAVRQRFGPPGEVLHRWARGEDDRPVIPPPTLPAVSLRSQCDEGTIEEAVASLHQLTDACAAELRERGLAGRLIQLNVEWKEERRQSETIAHQEHPSLPAQPSEEALPSISGKAKSEERDGPTPSLPIPYRIHSMLPQPGTTPGRQFRKSVHPPPLWREGDPATPEQPSAISGRTSTALRIPIDTAPPLFDAAQRLLIHLWKGRDSASSIAALELSVSQFEPPAQLALTQLLEEGTLRGMSPERRESLAFHEGLLASRHGKEPFRHLAGVDPGNIVTERRFRWGSGLPPAPRPSGKRRRRRG